MKKILHASALLSATLALSISIALLAVSTPQLYAQEYGKAGRIIKGAGAPANGTNEIQTITFGSGISAGTFVLKLNGESAAAITWSATNNTLRDNVDAALEALPSVGTSGVVTAVGTMTAGIGTLTVTFSGSNVAKRPVGAMTVTSQPTGGTITTPVTVSTPGVAPTGGGATEIGALYTDTTNGNLYINQVAGPNLSWVKVGPP